MKKLFTAALFSIVSLIAFSQIDIGVSKIEVIEPKTYLDGDTIFLGDTIGQIKITLYNYGSQTVDGSNFPNNSIPYKVKYNSDSTMFQQYMRFAINPGGTGFQRHPEAFPPTPPTSVSSLPEFPEGKGNLKLCIQTTYGGDTDPSNDEKCINLKIVDPADTVGPAASVSDVGYRQQFKIYTSGSKLHVISSTEVRDASVSVYSIQGKQVISEKLDHSGNGSNIIDIGQLETGFYLVGIRNASGRLYREKIYLD